MIDESESEGLVKNRRVIIAIVVLVVLAAVVGGVFYFTRSSGTSGVKTAVVTSV